MSVPLLSSNISGISNSLVQQAIDVLSNQSATLALKDQLAQQTQDFAIRNLAEQVSAGDWQAGIRTEKELLSKGVSLASA